jgi:hypothetical protein
MQNMSQNDKWPEAGSRAKASNAIFFQYCICAWIAALFWQEITLQNWGAAYVRNITSFWRLSLRRWYCMLWNSQWRPLVFETAILQAIAHVSIRQRIIGVSAYFDYMRVADTINSQKSEDHVITDKLPYMLLVTTKVPRMQSQIFYFHTGKI